MMRKKAYELETKLRPVRKCCVCHAFSFANTKVNPSAVNIMAISSTIYRRGSKATVIRSVPRTQVCTKCLALAIEAHDSISGRALWESLKGALRERYSDILKESGA